MTNDFFQWRNVRIVPILHNLMEFALEVRRQFRSFKPDCIAVEYPPTIEEKILQGIKRLPLLSIVHYEEKDGTFMYMLLEPIDGHVEALRLALAENIPCHFIDRDTEGYDLDFTPMPDPYTVTKIGHFPYCRAYLNAHRNDPRSMEDRLREKTMAYHLQQLSAKAERILFVGGLYHLPGLLDSLDRPQAEVIGRYQRKGVGLSHLHADSSREIMSEMPFLAVRYEKFRSDDIKEVPDRLKLNSELIEIARQEYWKNSKEDLLPSRIRVLNRFVQNYSLVSGNLVPDFYQLIVAARGVADDDFAYEVWNKGSDYIWQTDNPDLPLLELKGEDLYQGQRRIRFHRRIRTTRRRLVPVPVRERRREKNPGEWKRDFKGLYICSYPPEDVVIEGYGRRIRKRALEIKSEENSRIVPFETSMMDGIDIRQTLREWQDGKKIYVKENRPIRGKVGSVVVIFDEDLPEKGGKEEFPWKVTWLGEHDQESDMSFYASMAGEVMDGPGISRCQYGGFMLTYPPMRVYDIWRDPFFNAARNKPERLLMGAIDYCLEQHVVYVAGNPPSGWCRGMAVRHGKKIIYLPIGTFSPVTLRKLRRFHVLDGHHIRKYAHHYI